MSIHVEIGEGPFSSVGKRIGGEGKTPTRPGVMDPNDEYTPHFAVLPEADFEAIIHQVAAERREAMRSLNLDRRSG